MGIRDNECLTCNVDITALMPQAAYCASCYLKYREEQESNIDVAEQVRAEAWQDANTIEELKQWFTEYGGIEV